MPISDPRDRTVAYTHVSYLKSCPWAETAQRDTKSGVNCLHTPFMHRNKEVDRHTMLIVNIVFKTMIFRITDKKNNQSSVSYADREIPTLGSTDNAGKKVNLVSGIIRLHSGLDFSTNDSFFLSMH